MTTNRRRVLIVDDDEAILEVVSTAFTRRGFEVSVARDGAEALVRAELDSPDLVVLDIIMPRRSGLAVLERIRERDDARPAVIVVTADTNPQHEVSARAHGASEFLEKPFDVATLIGLAESLLRAD